MVLLPDSHVWLFFLSFCVLAGECNPCLELPLTHRAHMFCFYVYVLKTNKLLHKNMERRGTAEGLFWSPEDWADLNTKTGSYSKFESILFRLDCENCLNTSFVLFVHIPCTHIFVRAYPLVSMTDSFQ